MKIYSQIHFLKLRINSISEEDTSLKYMKIDKLLITIEELSVNNLGKQESRIKLNILSKK